MSNSSVQPKFSLGRLLATPAALQTIEDAGQTPGFFLDRHVQGDWGEVDDEDKPRMTKLWWTAAGCCRRIGRSRGAAVDHHRGGGRCGNRAATTILKPSEY